MDLPVLRRGSFHTEHVELIQTFYRGKNLYTGVVDGIYGLETEAATMDFQRSRGAYVDGVVGNETWGMAMSQGLEIVVSDDHTYKGPNWPAPPSDPRAKPSYGASRETAFGHIQYRSEPTAANPEAIVITNDWQSKHLTSVVIPQLRGVMGAPSSGEIFVHRATSELWRDWFVRIEREGFKDLILGFGGSWVPRFIRGSRTTLSNHAYGTAIDLNVPWNGLGRRPALVGQRGSVRELAEFSIEYGIYWGGWYSRRKDGMHFEVDPDFVLSR